MPGPGNVATNRPTQAPKTLKPPHAGPFHVLLKVRSENGETITAHREMIAKKGRALLGKTGKAIGPMFHKDIEKQLASGVRTFLFLTTREGWNGPYVTYRCALCRVSSKVEAGKGILIPAYYAFDTADVKTWFEIASMERLSREEMDRIFVLSSGRSIMSSIKSTAAVFRVGVSATKVL